ncbi:MAG: hypothetical protein ABIK89_07325 [Planctomycetota bacterium]
MNSSRNQSDGARPAPNLTAASGGGSFSTSGKSFATGGDTFAAAMREWLKSAPWFASSVAVHAVLVLVLANIEWRTVWTPDTPFFEASHTYDELEPLPDVEEPEKTEKTIEEIEKKLEEPVVNEVEPDMVVENPEDLPPISDDNVFDGISRNDVIGVGGGGPRFGRKYAPRAAAKGGGQAEQKAVQWGLEWLKRHQDPEGFWDCDGFDMQCTDSRCDGKGQALNDVGVTGLALLAFLGTGNTINSGPYKSVVRNGVRFLCDVQDPEDGCLVPKEGTHWMYNHAIATLALTEAYGLSKWPILKKHAQHALDFVHMSKNPGRAWRYNNGEVDPVEQNDVSVTGWMVMCLASAKDFGLRYDWRDMEDALRYLDEMTDSATGRTGYREKGTFSSREAGDESIWPFEESEAMTAVAILSRVFAGNVLNDIESQFPAIEAGAALLRKRPPEWSEEKGCIDYYYWYYGSYALYQLSGKGWDKWKTAMVKAVVENQVKEGCERGSWPPQRDPWGDSGGRVYSTALMTLCLEVFYRYDNVLGARY